MINFGQFQNKPHSELYLGMKTVSQEFGNVEDQSAKTTRVADFGCNMCFCMCDDFDGENSDRFFYSENVEADMNTNR